MFKGATQKVTKWWENNLFISRLIEVLAILSNPKKDLAFFIKLKTKFGIYSQSYQENNKPIYSNL